MFQLITSYARGKEANPLVTVGYSDGSVRVFDIDKISIVTKMQPFASEVTAIEACSNCKYSDRIYMSISYMA